MEEERPVPAQLHDVVDVAGRYGQVGPSMMPDLSWTSLDRLTPADLESLKVAYLKVSQPEMVSVVFEWLHATERDPAALDPRSTRTQIINLMGVFAVLAKKRIQPFGRLRDPVARLQQRSTHDGLPEELEFVADLVMRFGDVIASRGESSAQKMFQRLNAQTKKQLADAASRIREEGLYRRVILPFVEGGSAPRQTRLYGFCGFLDINDFELE